MRVSKLVFLAALAILGGCGSEEPLPENAPAGHDVVRAGFAHAKGSKDPGNNCASCHGEDLKGGKDRQPSCFSCHGKKW